MISFKQFLLEKPLNPAQRIARSRTMKRLMPKIQMKRKLAMKKKASFDQLKARSVKKATDIVRKKLAKGDYSSMTYSQKIQIDKKLEKKKGLIKKLSKKLIPAIKQAEADRIKKAKENS
jgi:hypothetical protein